MKLSDTIASLAAAARTASRGAVGGAADRLENLAGFGDNPGNLAARLYLPRGLAAGAALVVVLHGCTQTASGYDAGAGWSQLADERGFLLLFPEQRRANNPNLCFNWFSPADNARDQGEARSIRAMIAAVARDHAVDPSRIFITGLSAGGAMASVMLASYPDVFAGGAIIAGLPYGCASSVPEALERMHSGEEPDPARLGALVRKASIHEGPWPTISVWHGSADTVVNPANGRAIAAQWQSVHGAHEDMSEIVDGYQRRVWRDAAKRDVIEYYDITGMGHGTPLGTTGKHACGVAGAHMLEAGISSTRRIADFWGLMRASSSYQVPPIDAVKAETGSETVSADYPLPTIRTVRPTRLPPKATGQGQQDRIGKVIEDALRAAGLMR